MGPSSAIKPQYGALGGLPYEENIYNTAGLGQRKNQNSGLGMPSYNSASQSEIVVPERSSPSKLGMESDQRTSVKVYNPPGGKSSLNLGGYGGSVDDVPMAKKIGAGGARTGGRL